MKFLAIALLFGAVPVTVGGGFGAWTFGMTAAQIRAVTKHGPYKTFTNGDLETYNATLCGKKEDVQFYLKHGRVWRIVVVTYEGKSLDAAAKVWVWTHDCLQSLHGPLDTPGLHAANMQALAKQAKKLVASGTKVQMAPHTQSKNRFIFSSFAKEQFEYKQKHVVFYRVWVNYDEPAS